jgi:hypothetical protein
LAARVHIDDLEGLFQKTVTVEEGTRALLFGDGRLQQVLGPGRHPVEDDFWHSLVGKPPKCHAVLVSAGEHEAVFYFEDAIFTRDPLEVHVRLRAIFALGRPEVFVEKVMMRKTAVVIDDLRRIAGPVLAAAVRDAMSGVSAEEFHLPEKAPESRTLIEERVRLGAAPGLAEKGIDLVRVELMAILSPEVDARRQRRMRLVVAQWEKTDELAARESFFELYEKEQRQRLYELHSKLKIHVEKAALLQELRRVGLAEKTDRVMVEEDWKDVLASAERRGLLRADEKEALLHELATRQMERRRVEEFLNERLAVENRKRLEILELEYDNEKALKALDGELARRRRVWEASQRERIEKLELAHRSLEQIAQIRLKKKEAELELDLKRKREDAQIEAQRLQAFSQASAAAIAAVGPGDRAVLLHDLARTEALKGLTPEQILAISSRGDPAVAEAAKEILQAARRGEVEKATVEWALRLAEQERQMRQEQAETFERWGDRLERNRRAEEERTEALQKEIREAERRSADRAERVSREAMDQAARVAGDKVRLPGQQIVASSGPVVTPGSGSWRPCSRDGCEGLLPPGARFCPACGQRAGEE